MHCFVAFEFRFGDGETHQAWLRKMTASAMRFGHGQNDPMGEALLQDRESAQQREKRSEVFKVPGFPLAILRRKQRRKIDRETGIQVAGYLSQFSDSDAV